MTPTKTRKKTLFQTRLWIGGPLAFFLLLFFALPAFAEQEILPEKASASSTLQEAGYDHSPYQLFDYDWDTGWTEGAAGTGAGEYLTLQFPEKAVLTGFTIVPGFYKTQDLFYHNACPTRIRFSSGSFSQTFDLSGFAWDYGMNSLGGASFSFSSPVSGYSPMTVTVLDVREGSWYEDCVISEMHFYGTLSGGSAGPSSSSALPEGFEMHPISAVGSTVLVEPGYDHSGGKMFDRDWDTGWTEGAPGSGIGQSVNVNFGSGACLTGVSILPGYWKSEKLFYQNAAPTLLRFEAGGRSETLDLSAYGNKYGGQPVEGAYFAFSSPFYPDNSLKVTILDVREGDLYEDCVITEMHFYGYTGAVSEKTGPGEAEDGLEASYLWSAGSPAQNLELSDLWNLTGLAAKLYEHHESFSGAAAPADLWASDLTAEDKAFGLYWYLYHRLDSRPWEPGTGEYLSLYEFAGRAILQEIFAETTESDWNAFLSEYVLWRAGEVLNINGTGDFGGMSMYLFEDFHDVGMVGKRLRVSGSVKVYQESTDTFVKERDFEAYFNYTSSEGLNGWQFSELKVY